MRMIIRSSNPMGGHSSTTFAVKLNAREVECTLKFGKRVSGTHRLALVL
jgi:hypothetical protein